MTGAGDPIDDEDAFLYGTSTTDASPSHEAVHPMESLSESHARSADVGLKTEKPESNAAMNAGAANAPDVNADNVEEEEDSDESVRIYV